MSKNNCTARDPGLSQIQGGGSVPLVGVSRAPERLGEVQWVWTGPQRGKISLIGDESGLHTTLPLSVPTDIIMELPPHGKGMAPQAAASSTRPKVKGMGPWLWSTQDSQPPRTLRRRRLRQAFVVRSLMPCGPTSSQSFAWPLAGPPFSPCSECPLMVQMSLWSRAHISKLVAPSAEVGA